MPLKVSHAGSDWNLFTVIPEEVFADCRNRAEGMWGSGKPEKWYYAVPFVLIWLIVIALIIIAFT